MSWDKDIPIPTKAPKWDFEGADIGWSRAFQTREEADRFAIALRKYAQASDKDWGALLKPLNNYPPLIQEWRVWIVEKRKRKPLDNVKSNPLHQTTRYGVTRFRVALADAPTQYDELFQTPKSSTDTDDDIMLSTDTRRGGSVVIGKQPVARQIEVQDEITETGRRRKRKVTSE
jgi:hypothetical protein